MSLHIEANCEPIPGYRLIERIGGGGFGEVWKAEAPGGLHKAIKIIHGDLRSIDADSTRHAEQELRALKRLQGIRHPYLLSLERYDVVEGRVLIVTELADCNLWDRFREMRAQHRPGIPRGELLRYLEEAAEVLDLMNTQYQLQHLDIKPQNLFLVYNHVKVADFGLVKDLEGMRGQITGGVTPVYAAPETFDSVITRYCDQYSLAIVYQELLTGVRPFNGTSGQQLLIQHLREPPNLGPLPPADRAVVGRALAKKPEDRFPSCLQFIRALQQAGAETPPPPPTSGPSNSSRQETPVGVSRTVPPLPPVGAPGQQAEPLPPMETPRTELHLRKEESPAAPPMAYSVSDMVFPARLAPPEVTGNGAIVPAVLVGIGQSGLTVVREFRRMAHERYGASDRLPQLRTLFIDTDSETLHTATTGGPGALDPAEVIPARLGRPAHYLKPRRNGRSLIEGWFDPQTLYKIPRNPSTVGLRALGRLAFLDHYRVFAEKLLNSIDTCTHPDTLSAADRTTRLGLRSNRPRVYIIAGLGGGTGGGMFLDAGYAARHKLRQLGYSDAEVIGIFLLPAAERGAKGPGLANAYTSLRELNHFSQPETMFSAEFEERDGHVSDSGPPFSRCYVIPLPSAPRQGVAETANDSAQKAAGLLIGQLLSPVGRAADEARPALSDSGTHEQTVCAFGKAAYVWPRQALLSRAARWLGSSVLSRWTASDPEVIGQYVKGWLTQRWQTEQLGPEHLVPKLQQAGERILGQQPEALFNAEAQAYVPKGWFGRDADSAKLWQTLAKLQQLVGMPDERAVQRTVGQIEQKLDEAADASFRECWTTRPTSSSRSIGVLTGHVRMVTSVAVSPDGKTVASGSWDRTIKLWDAATSNCTTTLLGHAGDVTSVAFGPDGSKIASGSLDHMIRLWDPASGRELNTLRGHGGEVTSVVFSPDGRFIASAGWDKTVRIWDAQTGHLVSSLNGHTGVVTSVAFAPDSRTVASSSLDRTVKLWNVDKGRETATIRVQSSNDARATGSFNPRETPSMKASDSSEETKIGAPTPVPQVPPAATPTPPIVPRIVISPPPPSPLPPSSTAPVVQSTAPPPTASPAPPAPVPPAAPRLPTIATLPSRVPTAPAASPPQPTVAKPPVVIVPSAAPTAPRPTPATPNAVQPVRVPTPTPRASVSTPPMVRRQPEPAAPPPTPATPPTPPSSQHETFVDNWSFPASAPILADILGPSIGPQYFGAVPTSQPSVVVPQQPPSPTGGKTLRLGDLGSPSAPPPPSKPAEPEAPQIVVPTPEIQLPDAPVAPLSSAPSVRLLDLAPSGPAPAAPPEAPPIESPAPEILSAVEDEVVTVVGPSGSEQPVAIKLPEVQLRDLAATEDVQPEVSLPLIEPPTAEPLAEPPVVSEPITEEDLLAMPGPEEMELAKGDATDIDLTVHPPPAAPVETAVESEPQVRLPDLAIPEAVVVAPATPESIVDAGVPAFPTPVVELSTDLPEAQEVATPIAEPELRVAPQAAPLLSISDLAMPLEAHPVESELIVTDDTTRPEIIIPEQPVSKPTRSPAAIPTQPRRAPERPVRGSAFNTLAVSHDGSLVAATRGDASILVWQAGTGEMLQALHGHTGEVTALAFSPDGAIIAAGGADKSIRLWEVASGAEFKVLTGHRARVTAIAFSTDDLHLATAGWDGTIHIWDWVQGISEFTLWGHNDGVAALAYSPDGMALISGGEDGIVRLWDLIGRTKQLQISAHNAEVAAVAYASDGERFASVGGDGIVKIWDAGTGEEWLTINAHTGACSGVAFAPEGDLLATAGSDHQIRIWNANSGQLLQQLGGHKAEVTGLVFSPDGKALISSGWDRTIRFWDPYTGSETATLTEQGLLPRSSVRITPPRPPRPESRPAMQEHSPPPPTIPPPPAVPLPPPPAPVLRSPPPPAPVAEPAPLEPAPTAQVPIVPVRPLSETPPAAEYLPVTTDRFVLLTAGGDATVRVWSPSSQSEIRALKGHTREVTCLAISPDGHWLVTGSDDESIRLWDPLAQTERFRFVGHSGEITAVAFAADGRTLASSSSDMSVRVWDLPDGQTKRTILGHRVEVLALAFSPDGRILATGGRDGTIKLWDLSTGAERMTLRGHTKLVKAIAFTADGRQLLSGSWDWTARLWDPATGRTMQTFTGHGAAVASVACLPTGTGVVTASWDKTARLWAMNGSQPIRVLEGHADRLSSVAVSPDGGLIATGSFDGSVGLWSTTSGERSTLRSAGGRVQAVAFLPTRRA